MAGLFVVTKIIGERRSNEESCLYCSSSPENKKDLQINASLFFKCREADLNRRHEDFQSSALPTELSWLFAHRFYYSKGIFEWQAFF